MSRKKALSLPMEIIIAVVILIVIALAIIMMTTGSLTKWFEQSGTESTATACDICKQSFCIGKTGEDLDSEDRCATTCKDISTTVNCDALNGRDNG